MWTLSLMKVSLLNILWIEAFRANFFRCFYLGVGTTTADRVLSSQMQARVFLLSLANCAASFELFFFGIWFCPKKQLLHSRQEKILSSQLNTASYIRHSCWWVAWSVCYKPLHSESVKITYYLCESETIYEFLSDWESDRKCSYRAVKF